MPEKNVVRVYNAAMFVMRSWCFLSTCLLWGFAYRAGIDWNGALYSMGAVAWLIIFTERDSKMPYAELSPEGFCRLVKKKNKPKGRSTLITVSCLYQVETVRIEVGNPQISAPKPSIQVESRQNPPKPITTMGIRAYRGVVERVAANLVVVSVVKQFLDGVKNYLKNICKLLKRRD